MECCEKDGVVLIRDGDDTAVYFCESMDVALVPVPVVGPLQEFVSKLGALFAGPHTAVPDRPAARSALLPLFVGDPAQMRPASAIGRLTINISNKCNLRCSYCYAGHGRYHAPESLMPAARAEAIVEKLLAYYSGVGTVQFFGGEPLLNLPAIEAAGRAFDDAVKRGRLNRRPSMTATTNGTLSSPRVLETVRRWGMSLVVSWDGPESIHDAARPTRSGGPTSSAVRRTVGRLQAAGIPVEVECTYTARHLDAGFSVADLMQYFYETAGVERVHITSVTLARPLGLESNSNRQPDGGLSSNTLAQLYGEAARRTVDNVFRARGPTLSTALDIIERIATRNPGSEYCPAFFKQLSVAEDGSLYPCFMFIGDAAFHLGNLLEDTFPTERGVSVLARYIKEFGTEPSGTHRWYRGLFGGCIAGDYLERGSLASREETVRVTMIQECLLGIARNRLRVRESACGLA
jgi:uncharacterized protein